MRQFHAWPAGSEEGALILAGTARFLAAHTPTRRELSQVVRIATRLRPRRGPLRGVLRPDPSTVHAGGTFFGRLCEEFADAGQARPGAGFFFGTECSQSARIARSAATRASGWSSGTWW